MPLSCDCDYDYDGDSWFFYAPSDYQIMHYTGRRKRCCSCGEFIKLGAICTEFPRHRWPRTDIELRIYNYDDCAEIEMASWWMCEECSDLYFSLTDLGFCFEIGYESMRELVNEYAEVYGAQND